MSTNPPLPAHGWDVFELIEDPALLKTRRGQIPPHWTPRGGVVGDRPPTEEQVSHMRLQGTSRVCVVRYRIEPETAVHFEFADPEQQAELPRQTSLFEKESA